MIVAAVLWNDRHSDPSISLFTNPTEAIAYARARVHEFARDESDIEEGLTGAMTDAGWIYNGKYSCEGDGLRVEMIEIDKKVN